MNKRLQHSGDQLEVTYLPESQLKHPVHLVRSMWYDLLTSRELAWRLMRRDISAQYRQSLLGIIWAFIPPIVAAVGLSLAKNSNVVNIGDTNIPYPAYVMFSTALWQTFVESLNGPITAVNAAKPMLAKINFPREAIILAKLGEVLFNFAIKLLLIIAMFVIFKVPISWTVLIAPVALIHLILFGTTVGLFLAPIAGLYQDINKGLTALVGLWFFLTPVLYPVPQSGNFRFIVQLNPVTPLLVTTRELATAAPLSEPMGFWVASTITIVGIVLAWFFYRLAMPFVVERMSS